MSHLQYLYGEKDSSMWCNESFKVALSIKNSLLLAMKAMLCSKKKKDLDRIKAIDAEIDRNLMEIGDFTINN